MHFTLFGAGPLWLAVSSELPHSAIASFPVWFSSFSSGAPVFGGPSELKQPSYILPPIVEYFLPPDGVSLLYCALRRKTCVVGSVMDLMPNLLVHVSVTQTNTYQRRSRAWILGAVTACQHSESASINHNALDQNAANLYCFL